MMNNHGWLGVELVVVKGGYLYDYAIVKDRLFWQKNIESYHG